MTTLYKLYAGVTTLARLYIASKKINRMPNGELSPETMKQFITRVEEVTWETLNQIYEGKALEAELIRAQREENNESDSES